MAARRGQKVKLLYIVEILKKYSDEEHPINATEICEKLESAGVTAERKAIYGDINCLIDFGYDIIKTRVPKNGFFLGERDFEIPEIYLLSDAVRTAKFISAKKTRELTTKLDKMLSDYQAKKREKSIFIDSSSKAVNEEIFYTIDSISKAIESKKKITFKYGVRVLDKNRNIVTSYKEMEISPYAMTWQDDHYYLIGNHGKYDNLAHFRIDRMKTVEITEENARRFCEVCDYKEVFDVADYTKKLFNMFGGENEQIELKCSKAILEQVIDRFSEKIFIRNVTEESFTFSVTATISSALVTWIINYGNKIEVVSPESLRKMISDRAKEVIKLYEKD